MCIRGRMLAKKQQIIVLRNGVELYLDEERAEPLKDRLINLKTHFFSEIDGQVFNSADITGIFTPEALNDLKMKKSGKVKCDYGNWHLKDEVCKCGVQVKQYTPPIIEKPASKETVSKFREDMKKLLKKKTL
jgi:hypothetical protein